MYVLWMVAACLVLALGAVVYRLAFRRDRLQIGARGIRDRRLGWGWIPWDEIEGAYPPESSGNETLRLRLRATERLRRLLRSQPQSGVDPSVQGGTVEIRLDLRGTGVNSVELLQKIMARDSGSPPSYH